ncbi:MAG: T9SS type A sorting domain-containing protein [Bacteroidetes bacterium]|nr:T9SS type A sorting domain-containing protein [Bacteroidota bacterium]
MKFGHLIKFLFVLIILIAISTQAQQFNGTWSCNYATYDDESNGVGINVSSLGVIKENTFVALAYSTNGGTDFLVGYTNADSAKGRMGFYPYNGGWHQHWMSGFDDVEMTGAVSIFATSDSLIYVANNDPSRNVLVFKLGSDSVYSTDYRISTGSDSIYTVTVDGNGITYVSTYPGEGKQGQVLVFNSITKDDNWSGLHSPTAMTRITIPDTGIIRGIAANSNGSVVYVSNYSTKKIYCYTGSPATGYTLYSGFNFTLTDTLTSVGGTFLSPGPWGLSFMNTKNILFVACANNFMLGAGYEYGRIYALNPNTGEILNNLDCAKWNYDQTGGYNQRSGGTVGNVSGYTSPYNVAYDEKFNLYDQSYFGWTVDKWLFSGTLPTIPLTITSVEKTNNLVPDKFNLSQNYPNPFNPTTTIEFSVNKSSNISLSVYDINGRLISNLINSAYFNSGNYTVTFDASKLASGTYIYILTNGVEKLSKKMSLIK